MAEGICRSDHVTPLYPQNLALNSPTSLHSSLVGRATEFYTEKRWEVLDGTHLFQGRDWWLALVRTAINFLVAQMGKIFPDNRMTIYIYIYTWNIYEYKGFTSGVKFKYWILRSFLRLHDWNKIDGCLQMIRISKNSAQNPIISLQFKKVTRGSIWHPKDASWELTVL
jgi:hypothetical protein